MIRPTPQPSGFDSGGSIVKTGRSGGKIIDNQLLNLYPFKAQLELTPERNDPKDFRAFMRKASVITYIVKWRSPFSIN